MKFFYCLHMLRFKDWVPGFFWVPIVGAVLVSSSLKNIFLVALISFFTLAYAFIINNYFDVEIDKKHKRKIKANKNPLAQGYITERETLFIMIILLFFSFVLALRLNFIGFVFVGLSIITSTLYSIKHIRLKEKTGIDIVSHGLMFGFFPFLAGVTLSGGIIDFRFLFFGLLFLLLNCNALLSHQIIDYEEDLGNTKNTVTRIGRKMSFIFLIFFQFIFLLCFIAMFKYFFVNPWIYSLFVFLLFWVPLDCIRRAIKVSNGLVIKASKSCEIIIFLSKKLQSIFNTAFSIFKVF